MELPYDIHHLHTHPHPPSIYISITKRALSAGKIKVTVFWHEKGVILVKLLA